MPPQGPLHLSLIQGAHNLNTGAAHKAAQAGALSERGDAVVSVGNRGGMDGGDMAAISSAVQAGARSCLRRGGVNQGGKRDDRKGSPGRGTGAGATARWVSTG